jgi:hypothetical protein
MMGSGGQLKRKRAAWQANDVLQYWHFFRRTSYGADGDISFIQSP